MFNNFAVIYQVRSAVCRPDALYASVHVSDGLSLRVLLQELAVILGLAWA